MAAVLAATDGRCAACRRTLTGQRGFDWSIHHRLPRGMGGTKTASATDPAYLLALCGSGVSGCHGWIESHRSDAYDKGYLLRHTVPPTDPASVPVIPLVWTIAQVQVEG